MTTTQRRADASADRKTLLFCPACGHEAPIDGEWSVRRHRGAEGDRTVTECPECGDVVVSQPHFETDSRTPEWQSLAMVRPLFGFVNSVVRHDVL
mgnify:FL=1|jgi:predicted RNA-binding Zn-ribbon protein involved in translation (DUF1610 family)